MDDSLKLKIAASLDLPTDAAADPDVARALDEDPDARAYARDLHTLDHAMRNWPAKARTDAEWERLATRLDAKFEEVARERAKVRKGKKVSHAEPDPAAVPVFEDASTQAPESKLVMSEPQENDADLENLAALTRTSTVPSGVSVASLRPSLTDAVDDTSSGIVDIKKLAEIARAEAEKPAPKADAKPEADKPEAKSETKPAAKSSSKNDDVMVTPARAATPASVEAPPRKSGSTLWGAIGGMALMAAAFGLYTNMQSRSPNETTGGDAPSTTEAPAAAAPTSPTEAQSAPPVAMPPNAVPVAPPPTTQPEMAAPAESASATAQTGTVAVAAPTTAAAPAVADQAPPTAAPRPAEERAAVARDVAARRPVVAPAARAAAGAAPAPSVAAEHEVAPQRPAPAAPPVAAPAPTAAARPSAAPAAPGARSVDDLMNRVAGANAPAQAAAPEPSADLPERPTRSQITGVLSGLNNAVRSCTNGQTGTAPVSLVIANDGTVSSANVSGQFGGSAAGECISGVVRRAHFPRFRAQQVTLTYPFVILPPR